MDYIDEMYRRMLASQGRAPANAAFDQVLRTGQAPSQPTQFTSDELTPMSAEELSAFQKLNPKVQGISPTIVEGEGQMPIEYPDKYKVQVPQSEIIRQNVNEALLRQMKDAKTLSESAQALYGQREGQKAEMSEALRRLMETSEKSYSSPELDATIKMYQEKSAQAPNLPERDLVSEAILNLGPALGGMFLGEAGALAAPVALKGARDTFEGQRKEQIERVKMLREDTEKRLKAAIEAKKSGQESFDKSQQRELERGKAILSGTGDLAKMTNEELKTVEQNLIGLNKEIAKERGARATDIAKMERSSELEKAKEKRANILAGIAREKMDKPTEGERKGAFQYGLMEQAEKNIQDLKAKYGDYPSMKNKWFRTQKNIAGGMFGTTLMSDFLNSKVITPDVREQIQYELSFLESIGRIQSGAAINVGEWSQMREQYFPTYGDAKESVDSKEQQRKKALEGVGIIAGKAKSLISPPKSVVNKFPMEVRKGKQRATVSNENELKEARSEGWK